VLKIKKWMFDISKKHPELVEIVTIGKSIQKRSILALKVTSTFRLKAKSSLFSILFNSKIVDRHE
jgi:hypothetical protein